MSRLFRSMMAPLVVLALSASPVLANDPLAKALDEKAKDILPLLKKKKYANVGVLKFLVRHGDGAPKDNVGDLNLSLANKTEVALILGNADETFGVISKASQSVVDMEMTSANHLDEPGRKSFFTRKFTLSWSGEKVEPAAFITGVATIPSTLKTMTLKFQVFDKTGAIEEIPGEIVVPVDAKMLAESGYSYAMSRPVQKALVAGGPPPKREELQKEATNQAQLSPEMKKDEKPEPFAPLAASPVKLSILYNGKVVDITSDKVAEPQEKDKVEFLLENPGPGTYAVVMLVNGVNTLYQEQTAIEGCRKWVLEPNTSILIKGFQTDKEDAVPFKVLSAAESDSESVNYGTQSGIFRMVVIAGKLTEKPIMHDDLMDADASRMAIARTRGTSVPPGIKSQSLEAYQKDLRGRYRTGDGGRGLVVKGDKTERFETQQVHFQATTEIPVADISLRYYKPQR